MKCEDVVILCTFLRLEKLGTVNPYSDVAKVLISANISLLCVYINDDVILLTSRVYSVVQVGSIVIKHVGTAQLARKD